MRLQESIRRCREYDSDSDLIVVYAPRGKKVDLYAFWGILITEPKRICELTETIKKITVAKRVWSNEGLSSISPVPASYYVLNPSLYPDKFKIMLRPEHASYRLELEKRLRRRLEKETDPLELFGTLIAKAFPRQALRNMTIDISYESLFASFLNPSRFEIVRLQQNSDIPVIPYQHDKKLMKRWLEILGKVGYDRAYDEDKKEQIQLRS